MLSRVVCPPSTRNHHPLGVRLAGNSLCYSIRPMSPELPGRFNARGERIYPRSPVKISAHADEHDLVLEVWNAGEPIPTASVDKIFEPFWRHSVSTSRNGLGLGLHICSQIVRAHEGRISVTSTRENGTQFTARLPLGTRQPPRSSQLDPRLNVHSREKQSTPSESISASH